MMRVIDQLSRLLIFHDTRDRHAFQSVRRRAHSHLSKRFLERARHRSRVKHHVPPFVGPAAGGACGLGIGQIARNDVQPPPLSVQPGYRDRHRIRHIHRRFSFRRQRASRIALRSWRNRCPVMLAAALYCMALSEDFAISNSRLTEFASRGRSPAGTSASFPVTV